MSPSPPTPQPRVAPVAYVSFSAEITQVPTEGLLRACAELAQKGAKEVHLLLSTPGGGVAQGITLYNMLRGFPFKLITHNVGAVNSIGNVVFLAGEERYACPNSTFMFHGVGFDTKAGVRIEEKFLLERLDSLRADQAQIGSIIEQRATFGDGAEIQDLFLQAATKDATWAKAKGIVHDIRDVKVPAGAPVFQLVFQR